MKFGKKFYAITALIVVVVIAIALLIPQGAATIPLSINYQVGEKMSYETTETITAPIEGTMKTETINSTSTLEVVDFDGETYTLNHTLTSMVLDQPFSTSLTEKLNKTGYASYFLPGETKALLSNSSLLSTLLTKPEAKVGDTWEISLDTGNSTVGTKGMLTLTFGAIQEIKVPAGEYKVFRIDVSSSNLNSYVKIPGTSSLPGSPGAATISNIVMSISGQMYLEYGTCRQIESNMQFNISVQTKILNTETSYSSHMMLTQHIEA